MSPLQTYQVFPDIPESLSFLEVLFRNLWWSWRLDAIELFRRINPRLWEESGRNPILFSTLIPRERMKELAGDDSFLSHLDRVRRNFAEEVQELPAWEETVYGQRGAIAYFSMEFGIHESLPLFAGGLGILSGDHLKAASDIGLPLVGVGLMYRRGYFHQYLDQDGWQQEMYPETDLYHLPLERAKDPEGNEVHVSVRGPMGEIRAIVWKIDVGRIPLYLLDTNIPENNPDIRSTNDRLYVADPVVRLRQELVLGIGGMRALEKLGIRPKVVHLNEGHCAFAPLERLTRMVQDQHMDLDTAMQVIPRTTVFTTHTPVAAGHDAFDADLVLPCLGPYAEALGISEREILSWGQPPGSGPDEKLLMAVLALRMSRYCNGVSELHGDTARRMWAHVWPGRPAEEVPITHVTNGVHIPSWISIENALLFERYLGPSWYMRSWQQDIAKRIEEIYDEELWRAHEMARSRLIRCCRSIMVQQYGRRNAPKDMMADAESVLDQDVLTVAFARRFATYKRAYLLFMDPERLEAMITHATHPVQFIFAGKAHPKDDEGKGLIQNIIRFAKRASVRHRVVFLEDYDIYLARHLVQGADVWLNTPRRPFEACGTSGMKAALNGVLNVSTMDGWWCEGYAPDTGWAIGKGEDYEDPSYQDGVESRALYNVLENDVIPTFYDRKDGSAPHRWLKKVKGSMRMALEQLCAHEMVLKYEQEFYLPAAERSGPLLENGAGEAAKLAAQFKRLSALWKDIRIEAPFRERRGAFRVGDVMSVTAVVHLGQLKPSEVDVELYYGPIRSLDALAESNRSIMNVREERPDGTYLYECAVTCGDAGRFGFTVRATPAGDGLAKYAPGLITWA